MSSEETIQFISRVAHEINRAYCIAIGDNSQAPWSEAPPWQRNSIINGVEFRLSNPNARPSASHESWLKEKIYTGWVYGEVKNAELKIHPCIVPFDKLPVEQQVKDYLFKAVVIQLSSFLP